MGIMQIRGKMLDDFKESHGIEIARISGSKITGSGPFLLSRIMTRSIKLSVLAIMLFCAGSVFPTSLGVVLDNSLYVRRDTLEAARDPLTYAGALSLSLEKIGASNLSLFSDLGLANDFLDPDHKKFEFRTLYLDAPLNPNFDARIGRQLIYDLISKNVCVDGAKLEFDIGKQARLHGYLGEPIPSRYGTLFVRHNPDLLQGAVGADVAVHPTTWIGGEAAQIADTSGIGGRIPIAGYVDSRLSRFLGIRADAEYDVANEKMEQYALDLSGRPTSQLEWRAYVLGEDQAIDSTDAYERLVLGKYTNLSLEIGYNDRQNYVRGYYTARALANGSDHMTGISASLMNIFLDFEGGSGISGSSIKMAAGYARNLYESLRCGGEINYYIFKLSQNPTEEHSLTGRVYVDWIIPKTGLTIAPELQVLKNEYYKKDVRFLLNARYQFLSFWKS